MEPMLYNTRDINDGIKEWIDMSEYKDHERIEGEILLVNVTDKEVLKAKMEELNNWKDNDFMKEVICKGKGRLDTRRVITEKVKNNQKYCKARLVVRGFEEKDK